MSESVGFAGEISRVEFGGLRSDLIWHPLIESNPHVRG